MKPSCDWDPCRACMVSSSAGTSAAGIPGRSPISICTPDARAEISRRQAQLVDWWAASGRAQILDVGWLAFTADEVRSATTGTSSEVAELMLDPRCYTGLTRPSAVMGQVTPTGWQARLLLGDKHPTQRTRPRN